MQAEDQRYRSSRDAQAHQIANQSLFYWLQLQAIALILR